MKENSENPVLKPIDIKQLFRDKNPRLAKIIPGFIYYLLKKILRIDSINDFLKVHGHKTGFEFTEAVINDFNVSISIIGESNLPREGSKYIFVSNHPLGGFDGILLLDYLGRRYGPLKSLSNDILMNVKTMDVFLLPINKHGKQSVEAARIIHDVFNSDTPILTFPAGLVSRKEKGIIRDVEWKKNFISKSINYQRDIIPIHVSGHCTNTFYFIARLRKFLGIKSNIEMFLLPDETFRHRNEHITITFGYPVNWQTFNKNLSAAEWAQKMQDYVYELARGEITPFKDTK